MNINFGEHYHENSGLILSFVVTLTGVFFAFLGAFFIYRRSVKKDEEIRDLAQVRLYLETIEYFNLILKSVIKIAKGQAEYYYALGVDCENDPYDYHLPNLIASIKIPI